jgi:hypothetical protein
LNGSWSIVLAGRWPSISVSLLYLPRFGRFLLSYNFGDNRSFPAGLVFGIVVSLGGYLLSSLLGSVSEKDGFVFPNKIKVVK